MTSALHSTAHDSMESFSLRAICFVRYGRAQKKKQSLLSLFSSKFTFRFFFLPLHSVLFCCCSISMALSLSLPPLHILQYSDIVIDAFGNLSNLSQQPQRGGGGSDGSNNAIVPSCEQWKFLSLSRRSVCVCLE